MSKDLEAEKKRLLNDEMFEAVTKLKKEGKIRFLALFSRPNNMEELLMTAVNAGHFDVIQPSFNS